MKDIGIDLGTYKTIVYLKGTGIIFNEPSVVAYNVKNSKILAVGKEAYAMIGKAPSYIKVVRPILNGVIDNYIFTEMLIFHILKKIYKLNILKPRIAVCVPAIITDIERNAIINIMINIGAKKIFIIDEPIAAAIGEGIDISKPKGRLVVDIGGGSTDIAVLSLNGIVVKDSIKIAGDNFDEVVVKTVKDKYNLIIGYNFARDIKKFINYTTDNVAITVNGKDVFTGLPKKQKIYSNDFKDGFESLNFKIISTIKKVIERIPPDLLVDIQSEYLLLTGGGSKLNGLKERIEKEFKLKTLLPETASESVAIGTGKCFDFIKQIDEGVLEIKAYKK